jgi:hypothetical protein
MQVFPSSNLDDSTFHAKLQRGFKKKTEDTWSTDLETAAAQWMLVSYLPYHWSEVA